MNKAIIKSVGLLGLLFCLGAVGVTAMLQSTSASPEQGSQWARYQLTGSGLEGVDAVSAGDAWTVGSDGLLAHWNGTAWQAYDNSKLGTYSLYSVDMLTGSQAWATAGSGRILRYDGTDWALEPTNLGTTTLYDVSMVSATDGWAVGSSGRFADYDGTTWTQVQPGGTLTTTLFGIDMVSPTLGWAVGGASDQSGILGKIARYNGSTWVDDHTYNRILYDVDMLDPTYGWAVGQGGTLLEWNGSFWAPYTSPPSGAVNLQGVSVVSRTNAWAVGARNAFSNDIWHWDGTNWIAVTTPNGAPLRDVVMTSTGHGWIVGDRGTIYQYNGAAWNVDNSHWTTNGFYGLDFLNPNDGWAVGVLNASPPAYGLQHWNGTEWQIYQPPNFGTTMYDVGMAATNDVWAVGTTGNIFHWDGATWTRVTSPNLSLYALSVVSSSNAWAVGTSGNIVHYDGTTWASYVSPTTTNLWSIDMVNENEGWAGGTLGLMLHYQNGTWTRIQPNPAAYTIEGIHMLNENEGWAVGYNGTILHYLNGTWTTQTSPTTVNLLNVHMLNPNEGWAVGVDGTILHYLNGTWTQEINPTGRNLRDVHAFGVGGGWIVGESPGPKLYLGQVPQITPTPGVTTTPVPPTTTNTPVLPTLTSTGTSVPPTQTSTSVVTGTTTIAPSTSTPSSTSVGGSTATATSTACPIQFSDVDANNTFYTNIRCLACRGIVSGYSDGTFRPNNQVTRGQLAKMVSNAAGFSETVGGQTFEDVPPTNTFYEWIERLTTRGYMTGYVCGSPGEPCTTGRPYFRPFANATRGQTSKIVSNAAGFTEPPRGQTFQDVPPTHTFYEFIQRLASRNVMQGYPCGGPLEPCVGPENKPYFRPGNDVTRGQSAKIVANTFYPGCVTP